MAEHHSRQSLDLDIPERSPLDLGKIADLPLREFDVVDRLRRHLGDERGDFVVGEAEARRRPFVEAFAEFAHRRIAALGDIGDDAFDRGASLGVGLFLLAGERGSLDVAGHLHASCGCDSLALGTKRLSPDTPGCALFEPFWTLGRRYRIYIDRFFLPW